MDPMTSDVGGSVTAIHLGTGRAHHDAALARGQGPRAVVRQCGIDDGVAYTAGSAPAPERPVALNAVGGLDGSMVGTRVTLKPHVRWPSSIGEPCGLC